MTMYNQGQNNYLALTNQQPPQQVAVPSAEMYAAASPSMPVEANNLLISIATPLLTLMIHIKHTIEHHHVDKLFAQVAAEMNTFTQKLQKVNYPLRTIYAARYCLCTALDESVLGRSWGTKSCWVNQSLLSLFHKETWGGENFYIILEDMAKEPRKNMDFLEFGYYLMSLGFEGKFYGNQLSIREEVRNRVFYRIRNARTKPDRTLSQHWQDPLPLVETTQKRRQLKKLGIASLAILLITSIYYNYRVFSTAKPVVNQLNSIAVVSPVTTYSEVISRPIVQHKNSS